MSAEEASLLLHNILYASKQKEEDMVKYIAQTTRSDREIIRKTYDQAYPEMGLIKDINKKLSGDFQDICRRLFLTRPEYDAEQYERAMGGITKDRPALYELLFSRPAWLVEETKQAYFQKNQKNLETEVASAFSNPIKKVVPLFLTVPRRDNRNPSHELCQNLANELLSVKPAKWIEDQNIMTTVFAQCSPYELALVCRYYLKETGFMMLDVIKKFSSDIEEFFKELLSYVISPAEKFARRVKESVEGLGTDTNLLERIVLNRYDIDLFIIKQYYYQFYKTSVREDVEDDVTGGYKKVMTDLINQQTPEDVPAMRIFKKSS